MKATGIVAMSLLVLMIAIPVAATLPALTGNSGGTNTQIGQVNGKRPPEKAVSVQFLANGTIQIFRGADQIASGIPALQWAAPTSTTGVTLSPTQGRLTQTYAATQINIIYDCVLANTDLTITAHVTNNSAASVGGLVLVTVPFQFSATPTGTMPSWHDSYLAQQGLGAFHPGFLVPIGCVYAGDSTYSVAAWSPSELNRASLIQASFISSNALPNPMPVELHTNTTLNAGASTDFSIVLRITTDTTPAGLLSGYKALLRAMSYTPVAKPAMAFQAIAAQWVTPTDPYGYDTNIRRIDLPQGVNLYLQTETPTLKSAGSAGIIFWAPGGYQSTTMYPVDYDVNFNRIAATWPALLQGLQANGFRAGICARFGDTLNADGSARRADPNNPNDVTAMLARVDAVAKAGVDMWYVDSVCNDWPSTQMTAIAKKHLPASHLFFTEYATDISLGFAGAYCEWMGTATYWLTEQQRAQLLYLYPKSTWLCKDRSGYTTPAQLTALGFEPLTSD